MEFKIFYRLKDLTGIYWFLQKVILVESDSMKQDYCVFSNIIAKALGTTKASDNVLKKSFFELFAVAPRNGR